VERSSDENTRDVKLTRPLRVLAFLLIFVEPLGFAVAAAGSMNAIAVRGVSVVLVLLARLIATALSVAAGRALQDGRSTGVTLALIALPSSAAVQIFATITPYFPSNSPPGDAPVYVALLLLYYGSWSAYVSVSARQ
jgi:hypothetical protein